MAGPSDQDSGTFQCYPRLWASVHKGKINHLISKVEQVYWTNEKTAYLDVTATWLVVCLRYLGVLSVPDFSCSGSFGRRPPHSVIENPVPCHYTGVVWLSGRASASSSGLALNSLRQALADCSETENPWLAENNKYPWEAARWTFTVSLAGEGEICHTSH